jgi:hypothetical protein
LQNTAPSIRLEKDILRYALANPFAVLCNSLRLCVKNNLLHFEEYKKHNVIAMCGKDPVSARQDDKGSPF